MRGRAGHAISGPGGRRRPDASPPPVPHSLPSAVATGASRLPLSIFLIACDEEDRIGATIRAVRHLSDDIVVVDSGSTDRTRAIAEELGARVIERDWPGYGPQKRSAEQQCRHPLAAQPRRGRGGAPGSGGGNRGPVRGGRPDRDAYRLRIAEIFPGEGAPRWWSYALDPVRLYRRDKGEYADSIVHDRVKLAPDARVGRLTGIVHHFSVRSLGDQIEKLNRYSSAQVRDLLDKRARKVARFGAWYGELSDAGYWLRALVAEFPLNFLKAYFWRRHALRGFYGFLTAMNFAFFRYLRLAKYLEARRLIRQGLDPARPFAVARSDALEAGEATTAPDKGARWQAGGSPMGGSHA